MQQNNSQEFDVIFVTRRAYTFDDDAVSTSPSGTCRYDGDHTRTESVEFGPRQYIFLQRAPLETTTGICMGAQDLDLISTVVY